MASSVSGEPKRILVADDEKHILRLIELNLTRQGWTVVCVEDGRRAIEALELAPFDMAVIDLMMPYVDGFEVLKWIRIHEPTKDMKVILMSAQADALSKEDLEVQPDLWLTKPFVNIDWFDRFR